MARDLFDLRLVLYVETLELWVFEVASGAVRRGMEHLALLSPQRIEVVFGSLQSLGGLS